MISTNMKWRTLSLALMFVVSLSHKAAAVVQMDTPDSMNEMLSLINQFRAQNGVGPLCYQDKLKLSSARHSQYQAQANTMTHYENNTATYTMEQRANLAGYSWSALAENVAMTSGYTVQGIFEQWVNSPPHRANMLGGSYKHFGFSAFENGYGLVYGTQDFGYSNDACSNNNPVIIGAAVNQLSVSQSSTPPPVAKSVNTLTAAPPSAQSSTKTTVASRQVVKSTVVASSSSTTLPASSPMPKASTPAPASKTSASRPSQEAPSSSQPSTYGNGVLGTPSMIRATSDANFYVNSMTASFALVLASIVGPSLL